jgi:hypothetical protein
MASGIQAISAIDSPARATRSPLTRARQIALAAAAHTLGMKLADVRTALSQGGTLAQLANARGISAPALEKKLAAVLRNNLPDTTDAQVRGLASRIVSSSHRAAPDDAPASESDPASSSTLHLVA